MKVRLKETLIGPDLSAGVGTELDVDPEAGAALCDAGLAEPVAVTPAEKRETREAKSSRSTRAAPKKS